MEDPYEDLEIDIVYSDWKALNSVNIDFNGITVKFSCNDEEIIRKMKKFYNITENNNKYDGEVIYITQKTDVRKYLAPYDAKEHRLIEFGIPDFGYAKSLVLGVLGDIQQERKEYALHAGVAGNTAYIGPTLAGKSTHSMLEAKSGSRFLTDDWCYFKDNIAYRVEDNIMISKDFIDFLNINKKIIPEKSFAGKETKRLKYLFKINDIFEDADSCQKIDNFVLLFPKRTNYNIKEIDEEKFVSYVLRSTYHIPFNYFDRKDNNNEKVKERVKFWKKRYNNADNVFVVSTRNLNPIKTHELISKLLISV